MIRIIILLCIQFAVSQILFLQGSLTNKMEPKPPEILKSFGYPCETHKVTTKDGYILTLYRVPHGKNGSSGESKGAVFLQHGLFASSADWVILGPRQGFAYRLADAGYDVWISNSRGTDYSQEHVTLNPNSTPAQYWDFDWQEMGYYDLPAITDHILKETGLDKIFYIGHSQGTTQLLVAASTYPEEIANKIKAAFLLAPIAYLKHSDNLFLQLLSKTELLAKLGVKLIGNQKFAGNEGILSIANDLTCIIPPLADLCTNLVFLEGGLDRTQVNKTVFPILNNYVPADISTRQALHYFRHFNFPVFEKYDFGPEENLKRYGQATPPGFDLEAIEVPIYAYYGESDDLTEPPDREMLFGRINHTLRKVTKIKHPPWTHNDFLQAKDSFPLCYDVVIEDMDEVLGATDAAP